MRHLSLDLYDIQGDILKGLPKNYENFIFYKIVSPGLFKQHLRQHVIRRITNALLVHDRELAAQSRNTRHYGNLESFLGLNLGFTKGGVVQLRGIRPSLDPAFEKGANHPDTIKNLNDTPPSNWLRRLLCRQYRRPTSPTGIRTNTTKPTRSSASPLPMLCTRNTRRSSTPA